MEIDNESRIDELKAIIRKCIEMVIGSGRAGGLMLERMPLALLGLVALAVTHWTPVLGFAASGDASTEQGKGWYDPLEWFIKGGSLPQESQWYNETYGQNTTESMPAHPARGANRYYPLAETLSGSRPLEQYEGQILDVRSAWFRDAPLQVFARVHLDSGAITAVDLGPRNQLSDIDLGGLKGKRISFLAHSATIAGEKALVAHQIRLYGRTIRIDWSVPTR